MNKILPKIIVIGAGVSGMQAASLLDLQGYDVLILEAKHIHGGRVRSDYVFCGEILELGGEEIYGQYSPHYEIVKESGIEVVEENQLRVYMELDGCCKSEDEVIYNDEDVERALNIYNEIYEYNKKKNDDMSFLEYIKAEKISNRIKHILECMIAREWGTAFDKLSMKGMSAIKDESNHGEKNYLTHLMHRVSCLEGFLGYLKGLMNWLEGIHVDKLLEGICELPEGTGQLLEGINKEFGSRGKDGMSAMK